MRREPPSEIRLVPHSAGCVCTDISGGYTSSDDHDIPNATSLEENLFLENFNDCEHSMLLAAPPPISISTPSVRESKFDRDDISPNLTFHCLEQLTYQSCQ